MSALCIPEIFVCPTPTLGYPRLGSVAATLPSGSPPHEPQRREYPLSSFDGFIQGKHHDWLHGIRNGVVADGSEPREVSVTASGKRWIGETRHCWCLGLGMGMVPWPEGDGTGMKTLMVGVSSMIMGPLVKWVLFFPLSCWLVSSMGLFSH